jgi:hypothetical protein
MKVSKCNFFYTLKFDKKQEMPYVVLFSRQSTSLAKIKPLMLKKTHETGM